MNAEKLYIGTSGIVLPYKNQQAYPEALKGLSRLSVYSTIFNSLEMNSIFYKLPRPATIAQWTESVSKEFRFTFKLSKDVTHSPRLDFNNADLVKYFDVIAPARAKAGCLLIQFPPSVKCNSLRKVEDLISGIQQLNKDVWPLAVEFRSPCWYHDETYELLNQYHASMVYHDKWGSESPQPDLEADHIYLRFHGPRGDYKGSYDPGILHEYAEYVIDWMRSGKSVFVYFNNTIGDALGNARALRESIRERSGG